MSLMNMNTFHAPAEKLNDQLLKKQIKIFQNNKLLTQAFDSVNIIVIALNEQRQIIYANYPFINMLGLASEVSILGKRPGESIHCIHSEDCAGGCGTSESCRYCNSVNLILKTIHTKSPNSGEVVITTFSKGFELPLNLFENVSPLQLEDGTFYIVALMDISDAKRRKALEKVFFHDMINTAGALEGLLSVLKDAVPLEYKPEVEFVEDSFSGLVEEIMTQKHLLAAENNELKTDFITLKSDQIIQSVVKLYLTHDAASNKEILISSESQAVFFESDYTLLKKVLGNMVKNALESTPSGGKMEIGCRTFAISNSRHIEFWVHNSELIPLDVQTQIFQRSFSTKGTGRGLGTYSMKLFGEMYLNGKVSFTSSEGEGTIFRLTLPMS